MSGYKELYTELYIAVELFKEACENENNCSDMVITATNRKKTIAKANQVIEAKKYLYSLLAK